MAEVVLFSLASKVLNTIASPAFEKAYETAHSIKKARQDLQELIKTVQTIQSILVDAERQLQNSVAVKNWIGRVRDALYDADDLFDEVIADDLLKQQSDGYKALKKVSTPFSKLKTRYSIAEKVKDIRKCFDSISRDMSSFNFEKLHEPSSDTMRGVETGAFVNPGQVIGRDEEKKAVLDFVLDFESNVERNVSVIAIVGIGGMGKTTLAQLVYNDDIVSNDFKQRWWACINNISDNKEVTGKIFRSLTGKPYHDCSLNDLQSGIREYISKSGKFLLVLDDLWDEDHATGRELRSLLSSHDAKGSIIIVTTRSISVAEAMDADKTHVLDGLSEEASWNLFRSLAFTREKENDPNWVEVGKKIVKKCANVPLAVKSIAGLLYTKDSIQEWMFFEKEELSKIELRQGFIISALKLSYLHLSSNLKPCFAYFSLFPKNYDIDRDELIYLWIAQGYIMPKNEHQTVEEVGHGYFMELVRRSFLQRTRGRDTWKMHDLIHDLALNVAGEEISILIDGSSQLDKRIRHLSIDFETDNYSCNIPSSLLISCSQLRSFFFISGWFLYRSGLSVWPLTNFKLLRALGFANQNINEVPCSIGELKHLRYLDLSNNKFTHLPDSITKLVNLLTLIIRGCENLELLPRMLKKLVSLRHLDVTYCTGLRCMPSGFEELTCLQNLYCFKVGKVMRDGEISSSKVDALADLKLKGKLHILFDDDGDADELNGYECWQLPTTLSYLEISNFPWTRIRQWWQRADVHSNLVELCVEGSSTLKHLPPLRLLPCLKFLKLSYLTQLEYIEEVEEANRDSLFFPCLDRLILQFIPKLKGWSSRRVEAILAAQTKGKASDDHHHHLKLPSFPVLSFLEIFSCERLKSMPLLPCLHTLRLISISEELVFHLLSPPSPSPYLETLRIISCPFSNFPCINITSLRILELEACKKLKHLYLEPSLCHTLEVLRIEDCPMLELWDDEENRGVDWNSFSNLRQLDLIICKYQKPAMLPYCLQHFQDQGILRIIIRRYTIGFTVSCGGSWCHEEAVWRYVGDISNKSII